MKVYELIFSPEAIDEIKKIKKSDSQGYKKLEKLLTELLPWFKCSLGSLKSKIKARTLSGKFTTTSH